MRERTRHARSPPAFGAGGLRVKWLPFWNGAGNKLVVEKPFKPSYFVLPDPVTASLGAKLRFLRRKQGLKLQDLARHLRMGSGTLSQLERGICQTSIPVLNRILTFFQESAGETFPGPGDIFDQVMPVRNFASWLRNFRLRRGLEQTEVARKIGVSKVTICRYERNHSRPHRVIVARLRKAFGLNGEMDRFL